MDDLKLLFKALESQKGKAGVNEMGMQLLQQMMQPKEDPDEQLKQLFAQQALNDPSGPNFDLARKILGASGSELEGLFAGTKAPTGALGARLQELGEGDEEDAELMQRLKGLSEKQYGEYEKVGDMGAFEAVQRWGARAERGLMDRLGLRDVWESGRQYDPTQRGEIRSKKELEEDFLTKLGL